MTETLMKGRSAKRLSNWRNDQRRAGDRHPLLLVVATRLITTDLVDGGAVHLHARPQPARQRLRRWRDRRDLRLMQYMASGFAWAQERQRIPFPHAMIGTGVVVAAATGMGAWLWGLPFLTSNYTYVKLPFP